MIDSEYVFGPLDAFLDFDKVASFDVVNLRC